eukprot:scaffold15439_cov95-Isochrysis_galbana.AAC.2
MVNGVALAVGCSNAFCGASAKLGGVGGVDAAAEIMRGSKVRGAAAATRCGAVALWCCGALCLKAAKI